MIPCIASCWFFPVPQSVNVQAEGKSPVTFGVIVCTVSGPPVSSVAPSRPNAATPLKA